MAKETIACTTWDEIGPALDARKTPIIGFACGLCGQRVAEEFHSLTATTYHRVAEEECERLRAALDTLLTDTMHFAQMHHQAHHGEHSGTWLTCDRGLCPGAKRSISRALDAAKP